MNAIRKFFRKIAQRNRLNRKGWESFGYVLTNSPASNFYAKRSNWIFNLLNHGLKFKGTI